MKICFIISSRSQFLNQLSRLLQESSYYESRKIFIHEWRRKEEKTIYDSICHEIDKCSAEVLRSSRIILDEIINPNSLNPLNAGDSNADLVGSVVSKIILTFPELSFTFLNQIETQNWIRDEDRGLSKFLQALNTQHTNTGQSNESNENFHFSPLFDPKGFRDKIRKNINALKNLNDGFEVPRRTKLALAVDDEKAFSFFHGYAAYKVYNRCFMATDMSHVEKLNEIHQIEPLKFNIQFEDIYLNFSDRTHSLSNLEKRDEQYTFFNNVQSRNWITVGHQNSPNSKDNLDYKNVLQKHGRDVRFVNKPTSGLYDLLEKCSLLEDYHKDQKALQKAEGKNDNNSNNGHSTPGALREIGNNLKNRARIILKNANTIEDAIHAAVCAMEAKELLGYKTPITAIEAIGLQQEAEVTAECMFYGIEYNLLLKERFRDIDFDIEQTSKWFDKETQEKQKHNAQLQIIENLAKTFQNFNQFEEELECLAKARELKVGHNLNQNFLKRETKWNQKARFKGIYKSLNKFIRRVEFGATWYLNSCLQSLPNFLKSIFVWILLFAFLHHFAANGKIVLEFGWPDFEALVSSSRFFVAFDPAKYLENPKIGDGWLSLILTLQAMIAFFHLTMLASFVYLRLSRK